MQAATLHIRRGETLGLVGESGSGKSTLARCLVRLVVADEGAIRFGGTDLRPLSRAAWKPYRKRIQMVFQDPFASLNPRRRVGDILAEGPVAHGIAPRRSPARAPRSCSAWCSSTPARPAASRTSSAAASASASASPAPWRWSRSC